MNQKENDIIKKCSECKYSFKVLKNLHCINTGKRICSEDIPSWCPIKIIPKMKSKE